MTTHPLRVLMVGCGNIAGGFDVGRAANAWPYTHAGAYLRDGRFCVSACVEPDEQRRNAFMSAWSVPAGYSGIEQALQEHGSFDVISICSPTPCHAADLALAIAAKPKVIFCEKPITTTVAEARQLVAAALMEGVPLAVNYTRRWDPDVHALRVAIAAGCWGELRTVAGLYNKGLLNNGSHMLDLLDFLFGSCDVVAIGRPVADYFPDDPSLPLWLETTAGVPIHLACGHADDYAAFELQLVFSGGVITMEAGGLYWRERRVVPSDTFKGYSTLDAGTRRSGAYPQAMLRAMDNIFQAAHSGAVLASTGRSALSTHELCALIVQSATSGRYHTIEMGLTT